MWAVGTMQCCQQRITFHNEKCRQTLLLILVLFTSFVRGSVDAEPETCSYGLKTPGVTVPKGDLLIKYGNPLEIFCKLYEHNAEGFNASDLLFSNNSDVVSSEFTNIVNETTLRLYIPKPTPFSSTYSCKLRKPAKGSEKKTVAVCLNEVHVGISPQDVENFTCVSRNWENLTCKWKVPENYVPTIYKLFYHFGTGNGRYACPLDTDQKENYCFWDSETIPHYRAVQKNYVFTIYAENPFGKTHFDHLISHWAYVIPARPKDLAVGETTSHSAILNWSVAYPMDNFTPGLLVKIEYQSEHDSNNSWLLADTAHMKVSKNAHFNLTGLQYANTFYEARVYMKSSIAVDDNYWSEPATKGIRTKPAIPGANPKTDIGSFEINRESGRDVYVYWQNIDIHLRNGEKFAYEVIDIKENGIAKQLTPYEVTNAYAKFVGISRGSYSFTIVSSNVVGRSVESSKVHVPGEDDIPPQPVLFTKIAFQNGTFELSWKPPSNSSGIKNYTIFWCENVQDRPYQCTGFLDWVHVPKTETVKLLHVQKNNTYQFAISANSETASSGMVWASCTVIHNHGVSKMKKFWHETVNATCVKLEWNLDCSERIGTVKGFRVYYCPTLSPYKDQCKEEEKNDTVDDDPQVRGYYVVCNLKPYTTYRISIAVISSRLVEGPRSNFLFATTTEGAPEPVQNLTVSKVTNISMVVSWVPPVVTNGVIKYYEISYNARRKKVDATNVETILDVLTSFTNYTVGIAACTVNCSSVVSVFSQTKIGKAGKIEVPKVSILNTSLARVNWDPPPERGGLLDMYTVRVTSERERASSPPVYRNTTSTELKLPINCANEGWGQKYLFAVQALNWDGATWYTGPWSDNGEGSCVSSEMSGALIVFISLCGIMAMVAGCFGAFYAARRVWGHYNEMRHVKVTLPPGLASVNVYCPTSYSSY
ncbi:hypothetical protein PR048_030245 [Dryococelus australis]|uniref:Fibronectin type-III domain-containing protein n=1 Tax=Dryococelus australis TaxID=614101 RepID=A0ABQ9GB33_9NEOP|nr:hypothetical protein PR048_030245 [Dryococelus australis]